MYLTRFRINIARIGARRLLSSPQMMHAAVLSSFAEAPKPDADGPRILWRVDRDGAAATYPYIVSPARPDLTHPGEQGGRPGTGRWETFEYGPFLQPPTKGEPRDLRPTANPVRQARPDPPGGTGRLAGDRPMGDIRIRPVPQPAHQGRTVGLPPHGQPRAHGPPQE